MLRALLLLLLLTPSAAAFQWDLDQEEPHEVDLVVEGTLVRSEARAVLAHGALYEETRSTIVVHRVLYRDADAPAPGATVELYAAQSPWSPHVLHARDAFRRGMWLLDRSDVEGVYTSYRPRSWFPVDATPHPPAARLAGGQFDPTTGEAALEVRYENFGPAPADLDEVSFDASGRPRGLGRPLTLQGSSGGPSVVVLQAPSPEPARSRLHLDPWTYRRRTVRLLLPPELRHDVCVSLRLPLAVPDPQRRFEAAALWGRVDREPGDPPLWLSPGGPSRTALAWPPAALVAVLLVLGALLVALRRPLPLPGGRTWRFARGARWLGVWTVAVSAALLPWVVLRPGPHQLLSPIPAVGLLVDAALLALLARGLRARGVRVPGLRRLALLPLVLLAAQLLLRG